DWIHRVLALSAEICARDAAWRNAWRSEDDCNLACRIDAFVSVDIFRFDQPTIARENELAANFARATGRQIIGAGGQCSAVVFDFCLPAVCAIAPEFDALKKVSIVTGRLEAPMVQV